MLGLKYVIECKFFFDNIIVVYFLMVFLFVIYF